MGSPGNPQLPMGQAGQPGRPAGAQPASGPPPLPVAAGAGSSRPPWLLVGAGIFTLGVLLVAVFVTVILDHLPGGAKTADRDPVSQNDPEPAPDDGSRQRPDPVGSDRNGGGSPASPDPDGDGRPGGDNPRGSEAGSKHRSQPAPDRRPERPVRGDPFEDILALGRLLNLPAVERISLDPTAAPTEIARLYVDSPDECQLGILGADVVFGEGASIDLKRRVEDDGRLSWTVELNAPEAAGDAPVVLGKFGLAVQSLTFQWNASAPPAVRGERFRYTLLDVRVGSRSEVCALSAVREMNPEPLDLENELLELRLPSAVNVATPVADSLLLDVQIQGLPAEHAITNASGMEVWRSKEVSKRGTLTISEPGRSNKEFFEMKIAFRYIDDEILLRIRQFAHLTKIERPESRTPKLSPARKPWSRQELTNNCKRVDSELRKYRSEESNKAGFIKLLEKSKQWCEQMQALMDSLESNGQIHYQIYVLIDGRRVEIVRTRTL